jgi:hypothetical protein
MWFGINSWGPAAALIGQVAGETINLGGVIVLLSMAYHTERTNKPELR